MNQVELGTILHMEKGKKPQKQSKEIEDGFLPYVDIKAFEKGIIDSYASPEKCVLCDDGDLLSYAMALDLVLLDEPSKE